MTDDKLNLVLASAMIRALVETTPLFGLPRAYSAGRLELIENAAGPRVGVDGNAACAIVGENLQDGDSAFVTIDPARGVVPAQAEAVAQLYENLIGKGPIPSEYKLLCRACEWSAGGRIVMSFVESVTVPKTSGGGFIRIPCIVCPVCHGDTVMLTWGEPFLRHEVKP